MNILKKLIIEFYLDTLMIANIANLINKLL